MIRKIFTVVEFHNGKAHSAVSFTDVNDAEKKYIYQVGYLSGKKPADMDEAEAINEELNKSGMDMLIIFSTVKI